MNLRAVMLAMFGALVLLGLGGCTQLEWSVGLCWPMVAVRQPMRSRSMYSGRASSLGGVPSRRPRTVSHTKRS